MRGRSAPMLARLEAKTARGVPSPSIWAWSPDFMDWPFIHEKTGALPLRIVPAVGAAYRENYADKGQQATNQWLSDLAEKIGRGMGIAESDAVLCEAASQAAADCRHMLDDLPQCFVDVLEKLSKFADIRGLKIDREMPLRGLVARLTDAGWWRRQLRRAVAREIEAIAIGLGVVHRRGQMYASDETVQRHREQRRRNAVALAETIAVNEEGEEFTMAELAAKGVSNPDIRRGELMTRIRGFEEWATAAGDVGMFYTWTCPARMHAGKPGQKRVTPYDGTTPKEAAGYLSKQWAKFRAWLSRREIFLYGFRVAEPHSDGCPHWHLLLFMRPDVEPTVTAKMRHYAWESDAGELTTAKARSARFKAIKIDPEKGSASGYISKYIVKNINGDKGEGQAINAHAAESAERVRAWASCWGIRQFQQIGGPGVTIWRELRRIKATEEQGELFPHWQAADSGNWREFMDGMGGATIRRDLRPVQLWAESLPGKLNGYGEPAAPEICGVQVVKFRLPVVQRIHYETRAHQWTIRRKHEDRKGNSAARAEQWTKAEQCEVPVRADGGGGFVRDGIQKRAAIGQLLRDTEREEVQRSEGAGGVSGLEGFLGPKGTWTRVNNCTPTWWSEETENATSSRDMDGLEIGSFRESAKAWEKAVIFQQIENRRRIGAFGKFPAPPGNTEVSGAGTASD